MRRAVLLSSLPAASTRAGSESRNPAQASLAREAVRIRVAAHGEA